MPLESVTAEIVPESAASGHALFPKLAVSSTPETGALFASNSCARACRPFGAVLFSPSGTIKRILAPAGTIVVATWTLSACVAVCAGRLRSVACTVKVNVPPVVGVPLSKPELASVIPGGRIPDTNVQV